MVASDVEIRVKHDCPFVRLTEKYHDVELSFWCNKVHELVEIKCTSQESYIAAQKTMSDVSKVLDKRLEGESRYILSKCFCTHKNSVELILDDLDILPLYPMMNKQGWEYYRIIVFGPEDFKTMLERLEAHGYHVEVLSKTWFSGSLGKGLVSLDTLFNGITEKQAETLLRLYTDGYYESPRRKNLTEIAEEAGVPRSTLQDHLRRVEEHLVHNVIPFMRMYYK
ncbi:hypothetical protein GF326_04965 [Candidatus Bathyarchaeota archaeon]|nr:hypothetical protein [Candidatus Bathyarchaeota archaeon]